ncbi:EfeM/EfeO family lipoprotein [Solibacillus sp. FSL K6-1523]|uniref:EfeM/EfeO family lipoprotein n=1 Tax=Solibacillus sp. FSL K6-1523 TaxID=2921471 RepID=UPI0030F65238
MNYTKKLAVVFMSVAVLAACGDKNQQVEKEQVEQQEAVEEVKVAEEANLFRKYSATQMTDFVADTQLLATLVQEGKLEEAQKLYPLVTMYYERLLPITNDFEELDQAINGRITKGKEADSTGFQRLAFGLFQEKTTKGYEEVATQLASDVQALEQQLSTIDVSKNNVLASASAMFENMIKNRLTATSFANAEVYAVKAQTEAIEEIVKIFTARATTESVTTATEAIAQLNEVLEYYEVGKEDYVNYSFFTAKQKEELTAAIQHVQNALNDMDKTVQ